MGEYVGISIGNYEFITWKNSFSDLLLIFCENDFFFVEDEDNEGEENNHYYYKTTVQKAKECLDCYGYTIESARNNFEYCKTCEVEFYRFEIEDELKILNQLYTLDEYIKEFTFEKWSSSVKRYARMMSKDHYSWRLNDYRKLRKARKKKHTISNSIVLDSLEMGNDLFWGLDCDTVEKWCVFRIILEAFDNGEEIRLDYTNLHYGGWCDEKPDDDDFSVKKTIVLTEGKFDTFVLQNTIKLLYPHLSKFYSFLDFESFHPAGGTSFLTHYVRSFAGTGIENRVIALFDNDTAGLEQIDNLKTQDYPPNFKIIHLPDMKSFEKYPTLGPTGEVSLNINGKAASIEMYLGPNAIQNSKIRWKAYNEKRNDYQGEVTNKKEIQDKFKELLKSQPSDDPNWDDMRAVLRAIFNAFN